MKTYFSDWRNLLHVLIAFTIGYDITIIFGFPNRDNFPLSWNDLRTLLAPTLGAIVSAFISDRWEGHQEKISVGSYDKRDVICGFVFAYIGGLTALFYNNLITAVILTAISLVVIYNELKK